MVFVPSVTFVGHADASAAAVPWFAVIAMALLMLTQRPLV
jgi:hypothetical protein